MFHLLFADGIRLFAFVDIRINAVGKEAVNKMKPSIAFCKFSVFLIILFVFLLPVSACLATETPVSIQTSEALMKLLESSSTVGKAYVLQADLSIDTSTLGSGRVFAGSFDGNGHTITVEGGSGQGYAPLFDTLRGSVTNLHIVFKGDVLGAPFAYDAGYADPKDALVLSGISVTVQGSVRFARHDYSKYYASLLNGPNYGNWYIHYGGQPEDLATGFAWYIWGASVSDVSVQISGNVGQTDEIGHDATAAGFAYFAAKGSNNNLVRYSNIDINVEKDILVSTGKGHASAYGFATGTADSTAGFACNVMDEISNISISAQNITASSQQGSSSAIGFARFMQGYTHDCTVNVAGQISAVNVEGDADEDKYAYTNGDAYAYGFMLNTGGWSIDGRRSFVSNQVNVGSIEAKTSSEMYAGNAFASGFAHQMMNSSGSVPNLSYNNNHVNITNGDIQAQANKAGAVASGFVSSTGNDTSDRPDHIYGNTVSVNGSIWASSQEADATAAGYAYTSKTHRRDCHVTVQKDIAAYSPVQAIAAGFNGLQSIGSNYFIKDSTVVVHGDIKAVQTDSQQGIAVAAGLNAVVMKPTSGSASAKTSFQGNRVTVHGAVYTETNSQSDGLAGLMLGLSEHTEPSKGLLELKNNLFTGREVLLAVPGEKQYTPFTGAGALPVYSDTSENKVVFYRDGECPYAADLIFEQDASASPYGDLWLLSNKAGMHSPIFVAEQAPTCTEDGNIDHWHCENCRQYFLDAALAYPVSWEDILIKAPGHQFSSPFDYDSQYHWRSCAVCGTRVDQDVHVFEWVIDREPSASLPGLKHEECSICGYQKAPVEIPAGGAQVSEPPKTGDSNQPVLWICLLCLAGAGLAGSAVHSKGKSRS